ncbi:MAG TPA: DUF5671 domain-containing protein [Burkholderiaceae bacterium]|nr:DUF5671 domain-containing protein [Burkholderiaceae bacterium]
MASGTQELEFFARESLQRGLSRQDIEKALLTAGWSEEQVQSGLGAFADIPFPVPVPKPRTYLSARETFVYLLLFSTLYLSAYHVASLVFDFINRAFPDPAMRASTLLAFDSMRWSISSLIIAFPTFILLSRIVNRDLARHPVKRLSAVRRWLTYLTLFAAAGVLIGDLTTLVYNALGGELTVRFVLKVATVGLIVGTIFGYYLWDLRREERE